MKGLVSGFAVSLIACAAAFAQIGPENVVDVNLPVFSTEGEQVAVPAIASGRVGFPSLCSHCLIHSTQYRIVVPEGATRLVVELENLDDANGDLDLLLSYGTPSSEDETSIYADYASRGYGGTESIVLPLDEEGALRSGTYYVGVMSLIGEGSAFEIRAAAYGPTASSSTSVVSAAGGFTTYCNRTVGFSIERPADWMPIEASELLEDEVVGFRSPEAVSGERAVFKVARSNAAATGTAQTGYEEIRELMEAEPGYAFLDKSDVTIAGAEAVKYTFQREYDLGPATIVLTYWIADGTEWMVIFACTPVSAYSKYADVANRALASFARATACPEAIVAGPTEQPVVGTQDYGVLMGTVKDSFGQPLAGVTVRVGLRSTTTNDQGWFSLSGVSIGARINARFSLDGYATNYRLADVTGGESTFVEIVQAPVDAGTTFEASAGTTLTTPDGGVVTIPPGSLVDSQGRAYSGSTDIAVTAFDPTDENEMLAFPGDFVGISSSGETVPIKSFGFMDVTLRDRNGREVQLASGQRATLTIPVPSSMQTEAAALGTCPLWYYDTTAGVWREEGHGTYDAGRRAFVGTVSHLSTWNFDVSYPRAFISGRVITSTGLPVEGAAVRCWGKGWTYARWESGETSTGPDGRFHRIPVECTVDVHYRALKGGHESAVHTIGPLECGMEYDVGDILLDSPAVQCVLAWGENPEDLDSHLAGPSDLGLFHVYYSDQGSLSDPPYANLDTDDTTSFGPEVVSISRVVPGRYRYSVRHYAGDGDIATSGARVELIIPTLGIFRYTPPPNQPEGTDIWRVVDLVIGPSGEVSVVPINDYVTGDDESSLLEP